MSDLEWHGWSIENGPALHIGPLPSRKQITLYVVDGSVLTTMAFFKREADAKKVLGILDSLVTAGFSYGVAER